MKKRGAMMNMHVPSDIVIREIFLYLPFKSLCRFRCISKQYRSCIDDDQFKEEHRKRSMKASYILSWDGDDSTNLQLFSMSMDRYAHIKTIRTYKYSRALPSSYGMVCLHGRRGSKEIALFNPSSEELIPLPNLLHSTSYDIGFGFDPRSRRYKIVQLIANHETVKCFHIMTVTRNGSSWRSTDVKPSKIRVKLFASQPICLDGVLYWDANTNVLVFDLSTEGMHIIKSPVSWRRRCRLTLLEGKLCCYDMNQTDPMVLTMNIWKFDNLVVGWTPLYKFEINRSNSVVSACSLFPLYFYEDKKFLFQSKYFTQYEQRLYIYDSKDNTVKIYPMAKKGGVGPCYDLTVYSEAMNYPLD